MENLILVPGEIIGVDIDTLPDLSKKKRDGFKRLLVTNKEGIQFLPCIYAGTSKKGKRRLAVAVATPVDGGGTAFQPIGVGIVLTPEEAEPVIGKYMGVIHGTVDSLPPIIGIPGFPNVGIKIRREAENNFKFTANIEKNIKAIAQHASKSPKTRSLIYGPPSSGKTSLADRLCNDSGYPWVIVSPKYLTIGGQGAMGALAYIVALASQRKMCIMFDDIDELLGLLASGAGPEDEDGPTTGGLGLAAYYFILEAMKNHPMPLVFTAVGRFPVDHIISQCNSFFSLHFGAEDIKQIWNEICPTAKELGDEIAEENLPLAMMYAVVKQAEMIAKLAKHKVPNKEDVKTALTCFGKRDETKPGFARE